MNQLIHVRTMNYLHWLRHGLKGSGFLEMVPVERIDRNGLTEFTTLGPSINSTTHNAGSTHSTWAPDAVAVP